MDLPIHCAEDLLIYHLYTSTLVIMNLHVPFSAKHTPMLPSLWAPNARQAVDAPNLKASRATLATPAPAMLNFAPGQLPQVAVAATEDQKRH
ncbi:hypothetical protein TRIUR3_21661 [Triticum urartu]|uniref:Uncharacterized protein n=1 Tax=Triticum urartu TaxID=4572 RepID=M7ZEE4_TRIUA|nr:hypothetical protein TRIUR3_21661 [Triticum urartu]